MKRFATLLMLCAAVAIVAAHRTARRYRGENIRLQRNQTALADSLRRYVTLSGEYAASVGALTLRCDEYRRLRAADAERIRSLGIRIRRLESTAAAATATEVAIRAPVRDTLVVRDTVRDTVRLFRWRDPWVEVEGRIVRDSAECSVRSVDTLRQVVHRVPRRFLFIRFGTKAVRQEIVSSNPHTQVVYTEYVEVKRRRQR